MIDTPAALAELVDAVCQRECIALDTEFVWERTYYPKLGVVQAAFSKDEHYLIDVRAIEDLSPLGRVLADPHVVKILHDAPQDLTILRQATGAFPRRIFDTRCAAAFAGLSSTLSLNALLTEVLGIQLDKSETRADWLKRPLSPEQLAYAIEDVRHLPLARQELIARVQDKGRKSWLEDEMERYDNPQLYTERDSNLQFERIKGTGRLSPKNLAILRELAAWRDVEARRRDIPRSHVVSDEGLLGLARRKPQNLEQLSPFKGLSPRALKRYGPELIAAVAAGLSEPLPSMSRQQRPFEEEQLKKRLKLAQNLLEQQSAAGELDPPFVASRAELKELVRENPKQLENSHRVLQGWRREFFGNGLLELLAKANLETG